MEETSHGRAGLTFVPSAGLPRRPLRWDFSRQDKGHIGLYSSISSFVSLMFKVSR